MKKILAVLGAITLSSTTVGSVVSCGMGGKDWKVITVGIVDNGKDKSEVAMMNVAQQKFDEIYGDLGYKIEFKVYQDENKIPEQIDAVGNNQTIPDVFAPTVDRTAKLANSRDILPLEGEHSPWKEGGASILKNLHYNEDGQKDAQIKLDKINEEIAAGEPISLAKEDQWNAFLPYAVEASKFISTNSGYEDKFPVQYGITKHIGVGGGSAIVNIADDKFDKMFIDLGLIDPEEPRKDGHFNWLPDVTVSIDKLAEYMLNPENAADEKTRLIFTLVDRGMWWMYPVYANAIADVNQDDPIKIRELSAANRGVNWINDLAPEEIKDQRPLKYSSIFGNNHYKDSITDIVEKWFELFGSMMINAKFDLDNHKPPGKPGAEWDYKNLFMPSGNDLVQKNLINNEWAAGVNYEPGSYFDMLGGFQFFSNMDFSPLGKIEIFDHETDATRAKPYMDAGLNTWLTPAGSGQYVFNKNLIDLQKDPKMEKAEAAMRFVETTFGFYKDSPEGPIVGHGDGGVRNLRYQFASAGDNPVQLAILDKTNQNDQKFVDAMNEKVKIKFTRAQDEYPKWWAAISGDEAKQKAEKDAILRLETTSVDLAGELYRQGGDKLSLAPNRSAFDEAGDKDYHGQDAMMPALLAALTDNFETWDLIELNKHAPSFASALINKLAEQDKIKSDNE